MKITKLQIDRIDDALGIDRAIPGGGQRDDYIRRIARRGGVFIAYQDAAPMGFVCVDGNIFLHNPYVPILRVLPEHRRQGIGSALLAHVEKHIEGDRLFIGPRLNNARYIALLQRSGYELCGTIAGLRGEQAILIFSKDVGGRTDGPGL